MDAPRLSPIQNDYQTERGFQGQSDVLSHLLEQLIGLVRRQYLLIIVIIAFTMALGVVYLMTTPAIYTAHAKLMIDSGKARATATAGNAWYLCSDRFRRDRDAGRDPQIR